MDTNTRRKEALQLLQKEIQRTKWDIFTGVVCVGGSLLCFVFSFLASSRERLFLLVLAVVLIVLGCLLIPQKPSVALQELNSLQDVTTVGGLLEALPKTMGNTHREIIQLLTQLLPRFISTPDNYLREYHRRILYDLLLTTNLLTETEFLLAILAAVENNDSGSGLSYVRRLAHGSSTYPEELRIRTRARQCVTVLEQRMAQRDMSENLLRPSSAEQGADILLRPAVSPVEPPEELLRPHNDQ